MQVTTSWSKNGEPIALAQGTLEVAQDALRVNAKGTVFMYMVVPVIVTDANGKPVLKTQASGTLILRASPIIG